jgi:hypothetical protein
MKNILSILFFLAFISCENTTPDPVDLQRVSFMPTACSEPWDTKAYEGGNRGSRIIAYLKDNGVSDIFSFESENDGMIYCQACTCPSGETYSFAVSKSGYEKLKKVTPFDSYL